ncbi:MAG: glycosyltransferase [Candidatus Sulfotelmatobacter sp.]
MPDVLIITVNYRGADATEKFLESAARLQGFSRARILVVENGSGDGSAGRLRPLVAGFANVELLESATNRGYFGAANWALQQYTAPTLKTDWVIVCNNDITFDDRQFLEKLRQRDPGSVQVIAPAIIARQTGIDCNPSLRHRPSPWQLRRFRFGASNYHLMWCKQLLAPYVRTILHHLYFWRIKSRPDGSTQIYAAHGAFLIFSRSYFEAGGYIEDGFFLYAEEFSVAEICLRLGLRMVHDPGLQVFHHAHRVTGRLLNRTTFEYSQQGLNFILRNYFQPSPPDGFPNEDGEPTTRQRDSAAPLRGERSL